MSARPEWTTAVPDWEQRIIEGRSLIPFSPLFPSEAKAARDVFDSLIAAEVAGAPTYGEISRNWVKDFVSAVFGAYDPIAGERLIQFFFLLVPKKNWKALALDTPVATPDGFKTVSDIKIGDDVFTPSGAMTKVIGKSEVFTGRRCFEVQFCTGETVVCDAEHLWETSSFSAGSNGRRRTAVRTTAEIASTLRAKAGNAEFCNHQIPVSGALQMPPADLPIDPYVLGLWLGDGTSKSPEITASHDDAATYCRILSDRGVYFRLLAGSNGSALISLTAGRVAKGLRTGYSRADLAKLGVLRNKHIPRLYQRASVQQRLDLLRGLMDTDGGISTKGQATFYTTSPRLKADVIELIAGLGFKPSESVHPAVVNGKKCPDCYHVQFWPDRESSVFMLPRKAERQRAAIAGKARSRNRAITAVKQVASVPTQCIAVADASHQFLITSSFIATHNSGLAAGVMTTALQRNWRQSGEYLILSPTREIADNSFKPAADAIRDHPRLSKLLHCQENQRLITHRVTGATLKVVAADSEVVSGKKTIGLFVDELWLFGKRTNASSMLREAQGGLASRPEGFVIYASTQSDAPPAGVFAEKLERFRAIRDGKIHDPQSLGVFYEYPKEYLKKKLYLDPTTFHMVNPNLGASKSTSYIMKMFREAQEGNAAAMADFLAKELNVEITGGLRSDGWAGAQVWGRGEDKSITLETLLERCEVVIVSLDGGGLDDLLGLSVMGRERGTNTWLVWNKAFISPIAMERRKANQNEYDKFIADGDLVLIQNMTEDVSAVVAIAKQCKDSGLLHAVGVDPAGLGILVDALAEAKISTEDENLVGVKQGVALMGAIKATERKLADGTLRHAGQRLMTWCAGNAIVAPTSTGMRIARDESGFGKIDPLMATFNCAALMSLNPEAKGSVYKKRGALVL